MSMYKGDTKILNGSVFLGKDNYSTDEQVIGTWIDGKPLYRKVISLNCPNCTSDGTYADAATDASSLNIDYIMFKYVNIHISNGIQLPYVSIDLYGVPKMGGVVWYSATNKNIYARHDRLDFNNCPITAVIEFTKTTD